MAEQKKLREGTLKLLKSVLNPNKNGWPLKKLEREYKWLVGENIPFEKLGFSNLKDFLQDIPEIVLLEFDEKQVGVLSVTLPSFLECKVCIARAALA